MKGGFWIAADAGLFDRVSALLVAEGGVAFGDDFHRGVRLEDPEGRILLLEEPHPGMEYEYQEGPFVAAPGVSMPDMARCFACRFECRWEDLVVAVSGLIARSCERRTWLLDGDDVIWDTASVDPSRLVL